MSNRSTSLRSRHLYERGEMITHLSVWLRYCSTELERKEPLEERVLYFLSQKILKRDFERQINHDGVISSKTLKNNVYSQSTTLPRRVNEARRVLEKRLKCFGSHNINKTTEDSKELPRQRPKVFYGKVIQI